MTDPTKRAILHVDMDAFYASVETLDNPELEGQPVVVGGLGPRGVVSTANYAARKFGVHSAMPISLARRKCPLAQYVQPRMARYREVSGQVFTVFNSFTPLVEGLSLDEAFLDVTGSLKLFGDARQIAEKVKQTIRENVGLTASVGVAHNKFLAKLASDLQKPDGLVMVPTERVREFLDPMPIRRLWGIGPRTAPKLKSLGILTFGQLRRADAGMLRPALGNRTEHFRKLAAGLDEREVIPVHPDKSISHEVTFDENISDRKELLAELQLLSEAVTRRMRHRDLIAQTVSVKIRDATFKTITRSRSMRAGSNSTMTIYRMARALFENWRSAHANTAVRLLGVGVSGLEHPYGEGEGVGFSVGNQLDSGRDQRLDRLFDSINDRYGETRIVHGLTLRRRSADSKKAEK